MLNAEEKRFFADTARGAAGLSRCARPSGAVLVKGKRILSYGYGRKIIKDKEWEVTAAADALFGARDLDISGAILFSSRFPSLEDFKMLVFLGVVAVYFFGDTDDAGAVVFANALADSCIPLELVKLE